MVKRYAHMDGSPLAQFASNVTFTAQHHKKADDVTEKMAVNA